MAGGFWPVEQRLYRDNPGEFFRRFDDVVRAAERHHVGLIPSLFWHLSTVPDLVGEPIGAWGDPHSKTHGYLHDYVRDVVTRYRSSPAIWAWEFGNEYCLAADLPNAAQHRPPVAPQLGTPALRSARDELTYAAVRTAYAAFGREVRRWDPDRFLEGGDAFPRESAWHNWHEKSWTPDTPQQLLTMLRDDAPDPLDVLSVHVYGADVGRLADAMTASRRVGKPLFVGEFGAEGPPGQSEKPFAHQLGEIERLRVPLAAVWVYDYSRQEDLNITARNERSYQLRAVSAANTRIR